MSTFAEYFPIWSQLDAAQQTQLQRAAIRRTVCQGTILHHGAEDCVGLFLVQSGQLRAYILSDQGKEVTLYRLFDHDICLFSASCMLSGIQFDMIIEAETETTLFVIPVATYHALMQQSTVIANYTNQIMASRFSDVMWLMDQILFKSFDTRLATFLLDERGIEQNDTIALTHEKIAHHLGTAREVVTRMLKYFQQEGMVSLSRGGLTLLDRKRLQDMADA